VEPPGLFLRQSIELFTREAGVTCNICVYKVQAWLADDGKKKSAPEGKDKVEDIMPEGTKKPCDQLVPFILQLDLGLAVAVDEWREKVSQSRVGLSPES
jgi:hypothetical protein